jgi:UDP-galactopyranose mutase
MKKTKFLVVGSGFFGSVIAERIASVLKEPVLVVDQNPHAGGNSYAEYDSATNIERHLYGSHIFHTSSEKVWSYIRKFSEFNTYQHKVFASHKGRVYQMPINLKTINDFYGTNYSPSEAESFLKSEIDCYAVGNPRNLEEKAISLIGKPLYNTFIRGYTTKQWGQDPRTLPADIITRLPFRTSYNANYYRDPYQGIPLKGYKCVFEAMLNNPLIELRLNTRYSDVSNECSKDGYVIYSGMVDELLGYKYGELGWRSLRFEWETVDVDDYQGTAVMNYTEQEVPYTRIHEFKHYHPESDIQSRDKSIICREYPSPRAQGQVGYYPIQTQANQELYARYKAEAESSGKLLLGGRLGCYQYWDMDKAILNALECFENVICQRVKGYYA